LVLPTDVVTMGLCAQKTRAVPQSADRTIDAVGQNRAVLSRIVPECDFHNGSRCRNVKQFLDLIESLLGCHELEVQRRPQCIVVRKTLGNDNIVRHMLSHDIADVPTAVLVLKIPPDTDAWSVYSMENVPTKHALRRLLESDPSTGFLCDICCKKLCRREQRKDVTCVHCAYRMCMRCSLALCRVAFDQARSQVPCPHCRRSLADTNPSAMQPHWVNLDQVDAEYDEMLNIGVPGHWT
jgi:hypothetical protein